jgi:hypothetical protein
MINFDCSLYFNEIFKGKVLERPHPCKRKEVMIRVLVILTAVASLWIPEYLWAMDGVSDTGLLSCPHQVIVNMNIDRIWGDPCYQFSDKVLNS